MEPAAWCFTGEPSIGTDCNFTAGVKLKAAFLYFLADELRNREVSPDPTAMAPKPNPTIPSPNPENISSGLFLLLLAAIKNKDTTGNRRSNSCIFK